MEENNVKEIDCKKLILDIMYVCGVSEEEAVAYLGFCLGIQFKKIEKVSEMTPHE